MTREEAKRIGGELLAQSMIGGEEAEEKEYQDFLLCAIEALEKQIPMKIKRSGVYKKDYGIEPCDQVFCSACGKRIRVKYKSKYCDKCGQKLDWSEE